MREKIPQSKYTHITSAVQSCHRFGSELTIICSSLCSHSFVWCFPLSSWAGVVPLWSLYIRGSRGPVLPAFWWIMWKMSASLQTGTCSWWRIGHGQHQLNTSQLVNIHFNYLIIEILTWKHLQMSINLLIHKAEFNYGWKFVYFFRLRFDTGLFPFVASPLIDCILMPSL